MPGGKVLYGFARAGINANWLLTGEGPMLMNDLQAGAEQKADPLPLDLELMRGLLEMMEEELEARDLDLAPKNKARVVAILYDLCMKLGHLDKGALSNILDLAA